MGFEIENGVLKKYIQEDGVTEVIIPDTVTAIGDRAFEFCSDITGVSIPDTVTDIGFKAFCGCKKLTGITIPSSAAGIGDSAFWNCSELAEVIIPNSVESIGAKAFGWCEKLESFSVSAEKQLLPQDVFDSKLPSALTDKAMQLSYAMKDGALKQYILTDRIWKSLSPDDRFALFMTRQNKSCLPLFTALTDKETASDFAQRMLEIFKGKPSAKECNAAAAFILSFNDIVTADMLKSLYSALKNCSNGTKAAANIEKDKTLLTRLAEASVKMTEIERLITDIMTAENISVIQTEKTFRDFYSLASKALPELRDTDGNAVPDYVFAYLMTAHEQNNDCSEVFPKYRKAGIRPDIAPIIEKIDKEALQSALRKIADDNLGISGRSKKMYLAYPVCRYADDRLIEHLTSIAPKWKSYVSGNDAPPLRTFRDAVLYHDSRGAMLFAERYRDLDDYARIRNTTADFLRDKHMSDTGLDPDGTKTYDLGNQTVVIKMLPDLTFSVTAADGRILKSIPKKDADPEKYAAANADYSEIKSVVKKIAAARKNTLFEAFLNGKKQPAKDWTEAYLNNPLLRQTASLLVWCQDKSTFTLSSDGPTDSSGNAYAISEEAPICAAHPMEMTSADIRAWQKYFSDNKLKQPFLQIWEPAADAEKIKPDRYDGIEIPFNYLRGAEKHGIFIEDNDYHSDISIHADDCSFDYEFIGWYGHSLPEKVKFSNFRIDKFTRRSNHIIFLLDKWSAAGRIAKDDISAAEIITNATLAQLDYYIDIAAENNAVNCMAFLLELKNRNYPDFDPMEEYTLD